MNTVTLKKTHRLAVQQIQDYTNMNHGQFKKQSVWAIYHALTQREALIQSHKSRLIETKEHSEIRSKYKQYHETWTISEIASFLIKYREFIIQLIPSTNPPAIKRMIQLCELAKKYIGYGNN